MLDGNQPAIPSRVLLKLSGEALTVQGEMVIAPERLNRFAEEISIAAKLGIQIAIVIGGGNIFRGNKMKKALGIKTDPADHMGMLATVINSIAVQGALENLGHEVNVMSAVPMPAFCEPYLQRRAVSLLKKGRIVICAAGTGTPRFTTDTAAVIRAAEVGAKLVLKATDVEGIYDQNPKYHRDARMFIHLPYREAISRELKVMDGTAMTMAYEEDDLAIRVFSLLKLGNITAALKGESVGTLVDKNTDIVMADPPAAPAE